MIVDSRSRFLGQWVRAWSGASRLKASLGELKTQTSRNRGRPEYPGKDSWADGSE